MTPRFTTSATARNRPRCTAWCSGTPRPSSPRPKTLQVLHRVITRHLLGQACLKAVEANSCAVMLTERIGSAANLDIHLHCLGQDRV